MSYRVRPATLADAAILVRHRISMFTDMSVPIDRAALETVFRTWLGEMMPSGTYRAWLVEAANGEIAAGGGITILPWPPGPQYLGDTLAFAYNVYTEPAHRRRGLARLVMNAIHAWCGGNGVAWVALNASRDGRPLYTSMGYQVSPSPMMFYRVSGYNSSVQDGQKPTA